MGCVDFTVGRWVVVCARGLGGWCYCVVGLGYRWVLLVWGACAGSWFCALVWCWLRASVLCGVDIIWILLFGCCGGVAGRCGWWKFGWFFVVLVVLRWWIDVLTEFLCCRLVLCFGTFWRFCFVMWNADFVAFVAGLGGCGRLVLVS